MCGIAGIISFKQAIEDQDIAYVHQMNQAQIHRGPDDDGYYSDERCCLGMRRLAIVDLVHGQQPIWNENQSVLTFFNGEIYNYPELKVQLTSKGHRFKTNSDTEVLVHLYEEYGEQMFAHLNGMFAVCIYDRQKSQYLIGMDRFGEKPLFYYQNHEKLIFASEIQSLLANSEVPRRLCLEALPYYFRTSLVPTPITLLEDIKSLEPGHFLKIKDQRLTNHRYFKLDYQVDKSVQTVDQAVDRIEPLLRNAVKRQTMSDVPIGAFLSGGIDSSTMAALLQQQSSSPIKTFNVRFEDAAYDESPVARKVAEYLGTDHEEIVVDNQQFDETLFWNIINHVGQPFRDTSAIPSYLVSQAISKHVKVAISGDGGDELFGGYDLFGWYQKIRNLHQLPALIRKAGKVGSYLVKPFVDANRYRQLQRVINASELDDLELLISLNEQFGNSDLTLLNEKLLVKPLDRYYLPSGSYSELRKAMYFRMKYTLPDNMLVKVDRMSMANSLEVRAPFLDADLFAASAQLPDQFLRRDGVGKYVIRQMMQKQLPQEVFSHPKQGFNLPLHRFQNQSYEKLAKELVLQDQKINELFDGAKLSGIYELGLGMKSQHDKLSTFRASHQLWMMMQLSGWLRNFKVEL